MSSSPSPVTSQKAARTDVLLVDDSVTDLQLLMDMMTLRDLRISIALDGPSGYRQAVRLRPGLVLLDVRLPGMDGFTLCKRLKANRLTQSIPVIFLTAANDLAERLEGFAAGGVDYIGKPFEDQEVLARVGVHLQRPNPVPDKVPAGDLSNDAHLMAEAQQLLRDMINDPPGLEELSRLLGTNRRRLNETFQSLCGQPVYGWLREERLRQAYLLVTESASLFSTISDRLGYSTPANFTKAFRLRHGFAPSELRQRKLGAGNVVAN